MYRRYSQVGDGGMPVSQVNRNRIKNILIFLLIIAIAVLLVIGLPMVKSRENNRALYIQTIQRECKEAYAETSTLSRTAGADSAAILSRVRSNIHTIRIVNNLSGAEGNRPLLEEIEMRVLMDLRNEEP